MRERRRYDFPMDKHERRQKWLRDLIATHHGGKISRFARSVPNLPESYVGRMLYPAGKPGARGFTEDMVDRIMAAHPGAPHPDGMASAEISQDALSEIAVKMVIKSLVYALSENVPGAAEAFGEHLKAQAASAKPRPFSTRKGLLAAALGIAKQDQSDMAASRHSQQRVGSARRPK